MKRCPQCNRVETDDALVYCRADGTALVNDSGSIGATTGTANFGSPHTSSEIETSILPHATDANINRETAPTTALPARASARTGALAKPRRRKALLAVIIGMAAIAIVSALLVNSFLSRSSGGAIQSIAVLPFENRSNSADADYLCDGLAESLIYRFSQLPNLKVSPTSSVMRYKGKGGDLNTIANELGVRAVLTGRLVQRGDNLTISLELIDVVNQRLLWGEQFERKMSDLLATQREIATEVTHKLRLKLSGEGEQKLTKKYTDNNEAYQLYLKGRFYWNKRDEENLRKAIEQFKAAAEKDPNFALAYVGLADCYALLPEYTATPSGEALPQAKAYADRALQIDDSLGESHISLANVYSLTWAWEKADSEFKRGIELNPNYATGHKWYGLQLATLNRYDEALVELKRAQELEPLSISINLNVADVYFAKGDIDSAVEQIRKTIDLDPNWYYPHQYLGLGYLKQGRNAEALTEAEKSVELSKRHSIPLGVLGYIYSQTGKRKEALGIAEELKQRFGKRQANGYDLARVFVGLGDKDQAFAWLEKDFQAHSSLLPYWLGWPPLNSLRDDPRFKDLHKRMGVPDY